MAAIFLSPHLDDAVFSCGGLIWHLAQAGEQVAVWTVCAGSPPDENHSAFARSLHARWGLPGAAVAAARAEEDRRACALLGASVRHFELPDCIYRRGEDGDTLYASEAAIFGRLDDVDAARAGELAGQLAQGLAPQDAVYCPLAVGNHVDHQLTRAIAEELARPLVYYADVPYALKPGVSVEAHLPSGAAARRYTISKEALEAWAVACLAYASQVSSFWADEEALRGALAGYAGATHNGQVVWETQK